MEGKHKPNWWLLYLIVPLMIGLLVLEGRLADPPVVHQVMELGIVIVCFGLMAAWVHANQAELGSEEFEKGLWVLEPSPKAETDLDPHHLPLADAGKDREEGRYSLEASPAKGRFN